MKICLVDEGATREAATSTSSVSIYVHCLAQQFCLSGHSVDVICSPVPNKEKQVYNIHEVSRLRLSSSSNACMRAFYKLGFGLSSGLALKKLQRQNQYDIINFFTPAPAFFATLFASKDMPPFIFSTGRPVSGTKLAWEHQNVPLPIRVVSDAMHSYVFRRMTKINANSSQLKDMVVRFKIEPAKITAIPFTPIATDLFQPNIDCSELKRRYQLLEDELIVLCLAEVTPYKNQFSLVEAIPYVIQKHPEAKFVFVGPIASRKYCSQIQQFVHSNSLDKHVVFTGYIADYGDIPMYYSLADVYVLLSLAEGLPKSLLEAMSCGQAVVASSIPQNMEVAKRGDEMLFVDPFDIDAISSAINKLLDDPDLRRKLGGNARATIMEHYTPEVIARQLISVYEEVSAANKRGI